MKLIATTLAFGLTVLPALAQHTESAPPTQPDEGFSLIQESARLLFRGLMTELEPALRDLEPKLRQIIGMVDDLRNYHAPELLENGDIIMRRKLPSKLAPDAPQPPEVEL